MRPHKASSPRTPRVPVYWGHSTLIQEILASYVQCVKPSALPAHKDAMTARVVGDSSPVLADHAHPRQPGKNKHVKKKGEGDEEAKQPETGEEHSSGGGTECSRCDAVTRPWALTPWPECCFIA